LPVATDGAEADVERMLPSCVDEDAVLVAVDVLVFAVVGLSMAGDLRDELVFKGSAECWRFSWRL